MIIHVIVYHYSLVRENKKNMYVIEFLFIGKYCEQKLSWCEGSLNPCKNNGRCLRTNHGYQ